MSNQNKSTKNLTESNRDYSVFLPSISTFYNNYIAKQKYNPEHVPQSRIPKEFENGVEGCNFLNSEKGYYHYKWSLYSAGHAQLNLDKADRDDSMIQERDRKNTFILGDSGGFQIIKGVIQCDWKNFKSDDTLRQTILNWLEHTADYSMILDIPTMAAEPTYSKKTGVTSFEECLNYTKYNCDWFVKNRKGQTKYLNVMQGRNFDEAMTWYEEMKHYPFEGFAFGGGTKNDMKTVLTTLIKMRDDKLLDDRDLLHYLGISKLDWGVSYTAIKRALRETVNPNMEVTYDCASPFIATAKGQMYTQHIHKYDRFGYLMDSAVDSKSLANSDIPFPWSSPIGERMTLGDICHYAPGMLNKIGKEGKTSWDSFSYFLLMSHNVYQHIESVQRANALVDASVIEFGTNYKEWTKEKKGNKNSLFNPWVPRNTLYVVNFIHDLFRSENPMSMIDSAEEMLMDFSRVSNKFNSEKSFNNLFETENKVYESMDEGFTPEEQEEAMEFLEKIEERQT